MSTTPSPSSAAPEADQRAYRDALGAFATGVTIVTTSDADGEPIGVTASSFNSVSIDPPLVLWSLGRNARSRDAFCNSGHFAIHILTAAQEALSNQFAQSGTDKFADVPWAKGALGSPILADHAAVFECKVKHQYDGGDHIIMVGEVVAYEAREAAPLLFHGGRYAERRQRRTKDEAEPITAMVSAIAQTLSTHDEQTRATAETLLESYATAGELADARRVLGWLLEELNTPEQS